MVRYAFSVVIVCNLLLCNVIFYTGVDFKTSIRRGVQVFKLTLIFINSFNIDYY